MDPKNPEGDATPQAIERTEHSIMEGLPAAKAERVAAMRRELADLQRKLSEAQQRIAAEVQARAEDDDRLEALEAHVQAAQAKAQQDAAAIASFEIEVESRRQLIAKLSTTSDDLRRDITARDAQLEEARNQHAALTQQLEAQRTSADEAKTQHTARDVELATRTGERDTAREAIARLEKELEEERKKNNALTGEIAGHATVTAERDTLKSDLEKANTELETGRAKAREVAVQFARFGQELVEIGFLQPVRERPQPPPVPPPRPSGSSIPPPPKVDQIIEVKAEPEEKPSRLGGTVLMLLGGVILGSIVTYVIVSSTSSSASTPTNHEQTQSGAHAFDLNTAPPTMPAPTPSPGDPSVATNTTGSTQLPPTTPSTPTEAKGDGVLILPDEAAGHRLFVDGKIVEFEGTRATVACGKHEIQIGSRGTVRTLDIACGGETTVPPPL